MISLEEMDKKGMLHEYDPDIIKLKEATQRNVSSEDLEESYMNTQRHMPEIGLPLVGFITSFSRKLFSFTKLFIKITTNKFLGFFEWVIKFSENVNVSALEDMGMDYSNLENMGEEKETRKVRYYKKRQKKNSRKKQNKHRQKTKSNTSNTTRRRLTPPKVQREETIFDRMGL